MAISWRLGSFSRTSRCLCIFCSLVFFCFFCFGISNAINVSTGIIPPIGSTLTAGEVMKEDQSLLSPNRRFKLRFFSPDFTKYNRYLGIQIMNPSEVKIVWVANRENPLKDFTDGFFNITQEGNMVLTDSIETYVIFNSNQPAMSSSSSKASVTLLNSGNLVLTAGNQTVWQSFDHSSDTWLPGMKLGVVTGLKTGNQFLTSWMSPEAPAAGAYTFGIDENHGKQLVVWKRGVPYWRSGTKNGTEFSYLTDDIVRDYFNFSYLSNENESYYTISPVGNIPYVWLVMNSSGALDMYVHMGDTLDQVYITNCIDKNEYFSQGCVVPRPSNCKSGDDFLLTSGIMSEWDYNYMNNYSLSLNDCKVICMNNCSCIAYSSGDSDGSGCRFSHGQKLDFVTDNSDAETFYLRNVASLGKVVPPKKRTPLWLIISIPVVSLVIVSLLFLLCYRRKGNYCCFGFKDKKRNRSQGDTEIVKNELGASMAAIDKLGGAHEEDLGRNKNHELHLFNFSSIQVATDHFSDTNKLGEGGFGPVYKGKLADGQEIAVKRLSRTSRQGLEEFKNEVILIAKLQHMNLVRVLGCCIQGGERILIYEYLPNKSLDYFLFDAKKRALLDWKKRMSIIEGIAQGLLYLHKYSRLKIIHRDLKTSNILLDSNMHPKISDFGTARIFGEDEPRANTNRIVGTYGYMSPEYAMDGFFSVKSDVFSFGVVMLEILSGKKNTGFYQPDKALSLLGYVWDLWKGGRCLELMDQDLLDEICPIDDIMRYVHIGLLCVQENAVDRPTMSDVVSMLSHDLVPLPAPKQPAFSTVSSVDASEDLPKNPRQYSMNRITVSEIEAR